MWLIALLAAVAAPAFCGEYSLQLTPANTRIEWTLPDILHSVHGTFELKRGSIRFDPDSGKAAGEVVVDAASGDSGSAARDRRMHKEILESGRYLEAVFAPDKIEGRLPEGDSEADIHGELRIHGAAHEVTLHVTIHRKGDDISASARFLIPYVKWGMKNPSTFILRVSSQVEVEVRLAGRLTRAPLASRTYRD